MIDQLEYTTINIEISKEQLEVIERAAKIADMSVQEFVESVVYLEIIRSAQNVTKEDLKAVMDQETDQE